MILIERDSIVIKLRLPDKHQRLSKSDGCSVRLIYLVSKENNIVVFLDIYPKNGPMQKLDLSENELKNLLKVFIDETSSQALSVFDL